MAIIRRLPYRTHFGIEQQLHDIQRRMSALAPPSSVSRGADSSSAVSFHPSADVYRDGDDLVVEFELPGVDIDNDVDVSVHDGTLTVSGSRTSERSEEQDGVYLTERRSGSFSRSMSLPDGTDPDSIRADYDDGVLCIRMAVPEEREQPHGPRKISIGQGRSEDRAVSGSSHRADERGLNAGDDADQTTEAPTESSHEEAAAVKKSAAKKAAEKKTAEKKAASKKTAAKKTAEKKATAKKSAGKKAAGKKSAGKKAAGKKAAGKKAAGKKAAAKKVSGQSSGDEPSQF